MTLEKCSYTLHGVHVSSILGVFDGLPQTVHLQQDPVTSLQSQQPYSITQHRCQQRKLTLMQAWLLWSKWLQTKTLAQV